MGTTVRMCFELPPTPWRRPQVVFAQRRFYTAKPQAAATAALKAALSTAWADRELTMIPAGVPTSVEVVSVFQRPKCHFASDGVLRPGAPRWHTTAPDADNLLKLQVDALVGVVVTDDRQICKMSGEKKWAPPEHNTSQILISICWVDATAVAVNVAEAAGSAEPVPDAAVPMVPVGDEAAHVADAAEDSMQIAEVIDLTQD